MGVDLKNTKSFPTPPAAILALSTTNASTTAAPSDEFFLSPDALKCGMKAGGRGVTEVSTPRNSVIDDDSAQKYLMETFCLPPTTNRVTLEMIKIKLRLLQELNQSENKIYEMEDEYNEAISNNQIGGVLKGWESLLVQKKPLEALPKVFRKFYAESEKRRDHAFSFTSVTSKAYTPQENLLSLQPNSSVCYSSSSSSSSSPYILSTLLSSSSISPSYVKHQQQNNSTSNTLVSSSSNQISDSTHFNNLCDISPSAHRKNDESAMISPSFKSEKSIIDPKVIPSQSITKSSVTKGEVNEGSPSFSNPAVSACPSPKSYLNIQTKNDVFNNSINNSVNHILERTNSDSSTSHIASIAPPQASSSNLPSFSSNFQQLDCIIENCHDSFCEESTVIQEDFSSSNTNASSSSSSSKIEETMAVGDRGDDDVQGEGQNKDYNANDIVGRRRISAEYGREGSKGGLGRKELTTKTSFQAKGGDGSVKSTIKELQENTRKVVETGGLVLKGTSHSSGETCGASHKKLQEAHGLVEPIIKSSAQKLAPSLNLSNMNTRKRPSPRANASAERAVAVLPIYNREGQGFEPDVGISSRSGDVEINTNPVSLQTTGNQTIVSPPLKRRRGNANKTKTPPSTPLSTRRSVQAHSRNSVPVSTATTSQTPSGPSSAASSDISGLPSTTHLASSNIKASFSERRRRNTTSKDN